MALKVVTNRINQEIETHVSERKIIKQSLLLEVMITYG